MQPELVCSKSSVTSNRLGFEIAEAEEDNEDDNVDALPQADEGNDDEDDDDGETFRLF